MVRLIPLFAFGCAPWVWNQRHVDCEGIDDFTVNNQYSPMDLSVEPFDDADGRTCDVRAHGLREGLVDFPDNDTLVFEDILRVNTRTDDGVLDLNDRFHAFWGQTFPVWELDELVPGSVVEGGIPEPGFVEIDRVSIEGSGAIDSLTIDAEQPGVILLDGDRLDVVCNECSIRGVLGHFEAVRILVRDPKGPIELCLGAPDKLALYLSDLDPDNPPIVEIEVVSGSPDAADLQLDLTWKDDVLPLEPLQIRLRTPGGSDPVSDRLGAESGVVINGGMSDGACDFGYLQ